jgi:hypothetical protein
VSWCDRFKECFRVISAPEIARRIAFLVPL